MRSCNLPTVFRFFHVTIDVKGRRNTRTQREEKLIESERTKHSLFHDVGGVGDRQTDCDQKHSPTHAVCL